MLTRLSLVLCCLLLIAGNPGPVRQAAASQMDGAGELTPNDCSFLIHGADDPRPRLGELSCGTLDVPENWNEPEGRRIEIGYAVLKATGDDPAADPMVFLAGGPGTSPLTRIEAYAGVFAPLRENRDIVIFDQRGTRLSSPLRCEAQSIAMGVDLPPEVVEAAGEALPPPASYPDEIDAEALLQSAREHYGPIAAACVAQLEKTGVDLSQYNSIASANDVVALVDALGYDAYNLYGISYGTRLALEVMRLHGDSGLRSVVLDSTYPPEVKSYERFGDEPHEVVIQLFADCARDPDCAAAYPNLQQRFIDLLASLRAQPIVASDGTTISDLELIAVMQSLGGNVQGVPYVPAMIVALEQGKTELFEGIVDGSLFGESDAGSPVAVVEAAPATADTTAFSPARQLVIDLQAAVEALPGYESGGFQQQLIELDTLTHDRATLQAFIEQVLPGAEPAEMRASLLTAVDGMSDADVQEVFDVVVQTITLNDVMVTGSQVPQYYSVECNERIPFQSFGQMVTNAQHLAIPDLAMGVPEAFAKVFAICEEWPAGVAPAIEEEPVWSDIPTLILAGAYDNLTPVSWNKSAFATLPNAVFVLAPMAAHGVILYSSCAQDVVNAFMSDPSENPDTTCFAELRPAWVMPT